jgi:hypothetical protein
VREEILKLARHRLARAREALKDGQTLLAQGSLNSATNRLYYEGAVRTQHKPRTRARPPALLRAAGREAEDGWDGG